MADPTWMPMIPTPNHPEFPAGHVCNAAAISVALESVVGTNFSFSATSESAPAVGARTYPSLKAAALEVADSRWMGMVLDGDGG